MGREILQCLSRAAFAYALLILPANPLAQDYAAGYRAVANRIAMALPLEHDVWLRTDSTLGPGVDSSFIARHLVSGHAMRRPHSVRYFSWIATALLAAFVIATPIPWRHRAIGVVAGLLLHQAYLAMQMAAYLLLTYGGDAFHGAWRPLLDALALTPWYVVPLLSWWLVVGPLLVHLRSTSSSNLDLAVRGDLTADRDACARRSSVASLR